MPKYLHPLKPVRLWQNFIQPYDPNFEYNWVRIYQRWIYETYLSEVPTIVEFGCGSGINLIEYGRLHPEKKYVGLDWATASVDIVNTLAEKYGWDMKGRVFDFFNPDESFEIEEGSGVITVGGLEQTGRNYEDFLQYLLRQSPAVCFHGEPVVEWYDDDSLFDYTAIRFHKTRNYWQGFHDRLRELESQGKVEILKEQRGRFGNTYIEGYSHTVWRPRRERWV